MASWKKVVVSGSAISQLNNDANYISSAGQGILSSSAQIAADISGSFTSTSASIAADIAGITTSFTLAADSGTNDTFNSGETLTFAGDNSISTAVTDNTITISIGDGVVSGSGQVSLTGLSDYDANDHIDHTSVSITAGTGLTGGGDISATRTINVASANNGIVANADNIELDTASSTFTAGVKSKLDADNVISGSTFSSPSQGTVRATINGANTDVDTGLQTGDSPTFASLTLTGNLEVQGTTTTVDSTTIELGDNILSLNGTGAVLGGLHVNDANGPASGSILWDGTNNRWIAGASGSEVQVALLKTHGLLSGSAQIASNISGSFTSTSSSLASRITQNESDIAGITTSFTLSADSGTNDSFSSGGTLTFTGGNGIDTVVSDDQIAINGVAGLISASGQVDLTATDGYVANEHVDHSSVSITAGTGLTGGGDITTTRTINVASANNGIVANADNIELATASSTFTDGVKTKLDAESVISASAFSSPSQGTVRATINGNNTDVDTGLQSGDSPSFAGLTLTGAATGTNLTLSGDLVVNGTTTNINTSDLSIEDKFILLNSGSSSGNSGIIAQNSATNGQGTALFFDDTADRWSLDYAGADANNDTVTADAYVAAVAIDNTDANYQKDGNIHVDGSGDVFIYVE
jgi:hypothetical protein